MKHLPIAVDLDDVVVVFGHTLHAAAEKAGLNPPKFEDWYTYNLCTLLNINLEQFYSLIIRSEVLKNAPVVKGAKAALEQLKASGHQLVMITSRGYHPDAYAITMGWLKLHGIPCDELIVVPEGMTKPEAVALKYPNGFSYMIDDYQKNLADMKAAGMVQRTVLVDKPWNKALTEYRMGVNRFESLATFVESLKVEVCPPSQRRQEEEAALAI